MSSEYTAESIKILSDIEHIRKNPGMYIGDISTPVHLLTEAIDNALDEIMNGYSNGMTVSITKTVTDDMIYSVEDFGRGIPAGYKEIDDKKVAILEAILTKNNTGGKFDSSAYMNSTGLHGLGIKCINALSDEVHVVSVNNGKKGIISTVNGEVVEEVKYEKTNNKSGTLITFTIKKDNKHFDNNQIPFDSIVNKLNSYQGFGVKGIKLILNGYDVTETYITATSPFDLYKHPMDKGDSAIIADVTVETENKERFRFAFNYVSTSTSYAFHGHVNFLPCHQGGHIMAAQDALIKAFDIFCEKRNIVKPSTMASDYYIGLNAIAFCNIIEKSFASQTKDKLITGTGNTRDYFKNLVNLLAEKINTDVFDKNVGIVKALIQRIADYRRERENRKELKGLSQYITINQSESSTVRRGSVYEKLVECSNKNRDECELIMTEGDSASGGLIRTRNKKNVAVLPLKGKIKNVVGCTMTDVLKNKEIAGIISSVGTGIFDKCDVERIRYRDIMYAGDADADGYHITNLVVSLFVNYMPAVVKAGKLKLIISPLYIYKDKGEWQSADKLEDMPKTVVEKEQFTRIKGLGSLDDDQIREFLLNINKRKVLTVRYPSDIKEFNHIMGSSEGRRDLLTGLGILQE